MYESLAIISAFAFLYSLFAGAIERTWVSAAIVFTAFGVLVSPAGLDLLPLAGDPETIKRLAELTLALVLFTDAASADLATLRNVRKLPRRLLLVGLPLTIGMGFAAALVVFEDFSLVMAALLATILAPTDAALGRPVVSNRAVPAPYRAALNVESGLNDGICVPVLLLFLALAAGEHTDDTGRFMIHLFAEEIGIGLLAGVGMTVVGAGLGRFVDARGWLDPVWGMVSLAALALACFGLAQALGGSGFIASFAGGLTLNRLFTEPGKAKWIERTESFGNLFSLVTWTAFGALVVGVTLEHATVSMVVYALLSLTVIRMLPVFLALNGLGISTEAKLFLGWFGPRGLASVVFSVIVLNTMLPGTEQIAYTAALTIILSILLHGVTANAWARGFAARELRRHASTEKDVRFAGTETRVQRRAEAPEDMGRGPLGR